ncbi:MAG: metal-sulfur cluster assembly factor [Ktedonobacterales bacterium]
MTYMTHMTHADSPVGGSASYPDQVRVPSGTSEAGAAAYPRDELWDALREVEDPELAISLVDMGLVVGIQREGSQVGIQLTYTMMGCPAMEMIQDDIRSRLLAMAGIDSVDIEVVWEPVWTKDRLTSEGREALLICGVSL